MKTCQGKLSCKKGFGCKHLISHMSPTRTFKHFEGSRVMKRPSHDSDCKFFRTQLQKIKI